VILAYDEIVGHMRERIEIPEKGVLPVQDRRRPTCPPSEYKPFDETQGDVPPIADFFSGYRQHITGLNHAPDGFPVNASPRIHTDEMRLLRKVEANRKDILRNERILLDDAEVAVFAYGVSGRSGKNAVELARAEGIKAGLLRPLTIWPFPEEDVGTLASRVKAIIVPELSLGQIVLEVDRCARGRCKVEGIYRVDGDPITPAQILEKIKEVR
jgi:2-oxoglutarate ferredoxin oxidoreductase subunit alpha